MLTPRFPAFVLAVLAMTLCHGNGGLPRESPAAAKKPQIAGFRTPAHFEENVGQVADERVRFLARRGRASLYLDDAGSTLAVGDVQVTMRVAGGRGVSPVASRPLEAKTHYLVGPESEWHTNVANYERVTYPSVLDGVDWVFHGEDGQLEYDFVLAPGVDASRVAIEIGGTDSVRVNEAGDLVLVTPHGEVVQAAPRVFQGSRTVAARYRISGSNQVAFNIADYDHSQPLVIDPTVVFATYLGSTGTDTAFSLTTDSDGNVYVAGSAERSTGINGVATSTRIGPTLSASATSDMYVAKLTPAGTLSFLTYVGGNGFEEANSVAVTSTGRPVIAGYTTSTDIPTAGGPAQATKGAGQDIYVAELASTGASLLYASYMDLGCAAAGCTTHNDVAYGVALNGDDVYVTGSTSAQSPTTLTAARDGVFVYAFSLTAPTPAKYVKYLGGGAQAIADSIAVNSAGAAFIAGQANNGSMTNSVAFTMQNGADTSPGTGTAGNAFFAKLDSAGAVQYGTYLRGSASNSNDHAYAVAIDSAGIATVAGETASADFRTSLNALQTTFGGGLTDAFVARIDPSAIGTASLVFSTYLGGTGQEGAHGVARDANGDAVVTGYTTSSNFNLPVAQAPSGGQDAFVTVLGADGKTLVGSVLVGGSSNEGGHGVGVVGNDVVVCGFTNSSDFPTKTPAQGSAGGGIDAFVARVNLTPPGITLNAPATTTPPNGMLTFTASGGTGVLTFDLAANASGGKITADGSYTAGATPNVIDTVRVKDSIGGTKSVDVHVGPGVTITPSTGNLKDGESRQLTAAGGNGGPYTWEFSDSVQGKSITSTGLFTSDGKAAHIHATDSLGNRGFADFNVSALVITPALAYPALGERLMFTVSGGTPPYTWGPPDFGEYEQTTGTTITFKTGIVEGRTETVRVKDSTGAEAVALLYPLPALRLSPPQSDVGPGGTVTLNASGGKSPYSFSISKNESGATFDSAALIYKAGDRIGIDQVTVTDSVGATAVAGINVTQNGGATGTTPPPADTSNACGCRAVGSTKTRTSLAGLLAAVALFALHRRRRR